ncbi:hypothetical protein TIFTF001_033028 [Ficus carica]|uniref:Uncharacterized protein n=1 Tax=Ficus carica TaxID=3494 RepID=A0AA88DYE7_FICCA|nr:hypothetical protein TIFTF001_033028 [Ficus carica]
MQAFREGIKDARLVWTLAYDRPPTFVQLRGIAWRHAEADEYVRGRGLASGEHSRLPGRKSEKNQTDQDRQDKGKAVVVDKSGSNPSPRTPAGRFQQYTPLVTTIEHVLNQVTGRGLLRDPPPLRADRARRNQNKYCNFHKDVGHDTKDCIQLRDQIELLIRDGHLREFVERIITPAGPSRPAQAARRNPRPSDQTDEQEQEHIVHTIFGGTATGDTASSRRSYVREARQYACGEYINMAEHISKICRQDSTPITFTDDEADRLLHPHNDALIGEIRVAGNVIRRVLIDNGSSADIMFMDAFSRLKIEGAALTPARTPLYGFSGDFVRAAGTVCLPVTIGDGPERVTRMVEFIVVDRPSVYNVILGRPTLNATKAVVSTYHLAMKFPTEGGVGVFRGNQEGARKCYMKAVNKVCRKAPAPITVATVFTVDEAEAPSGEVARSRDLVMKRVLVQEPGLGSFGSKWDGPYTITGVVRPETYRLSDQDGRNLGLPWNADHLKRLITGHRPELDVPDQDPPALAGISSVVLGLQLGLMTGHRSELDVPDQDTPALAGTRDPMFVTDQGWSWMKNTQTNQGGNTLQYINVATMTK